MIKPYETVEIKVDASNIDAIQAVDTANRRVGLESASDTFLELNKGNRDNQQIRLQTFTNDTRSLNLVGKTPLHLKERKANEFDAQGFLNKEYIDTLVDVVANGNDDTKSIMYGLRQQVGNSIQFSAPVNLASNKAGFVFNRSCQSVIPGNSIEIAGPPFNEAKKQAESHFYYLISEKDARTSKPPKDIKVLYLDLEGKEQTGNQDAVNKLIASKQCLPIVIATESASVKVTAAGNEISTSHNYRVQPDFLKWTGPTYPKMVSLDQKTSNYHIAFLDAKVKSLTGLVAVNTELMSHMDKNSVGYHHLAHDVNMLSSQSVQMVTQLNNVKVLEQSYQSASFIKKSTAVRNLNLAIVKLQETVRAVEGELHCNRSDLNQLNQLSQKKPIEATPGEPVVQEAVQQKVVAEKENLKRLNNVDTHQHEPILNYSKMQVEEEQIKRESRVEEHTKQQDEPEPKKHRRDRGGA